MFHFVGPFSPYFLPMFLVKIWGVSFGFNQPTNLTNLRSWHLRRICLISVTWWLSPVLPWPSPGSPKIRKRGRKTADRQKHVLLGRDGWDGDVETQKTAGFFVGWLGWDLFVWLFLVGLFFQGRFFGDGLTFQKVVWRIFGCWKLAGEETTHCVDFERWIVFS